jgi:putative acetyltransferase
MRADVLIRAERAAERTTIHAVVAAAFPTDSEARLVDALRDDGMLRVSLVAEVDGRIAGHVAFSPITIDGRSLRPDALGLAPVAVLPPHQRRGIGAALVRAGLDACRAVATPLVVVLGEPAYYRRFGFRPASTWRLGNHYGAGDEFMAQELVAGATPPAGGLVGYAPAFTAL